ncbi:MAG TPA: hypothetical protein VIP98_01775 [Microlunatus sp.]
MLSEHAETTTTGTSVRGTLYHSPVSRPHGDQLLPLKAMRQPYPDLYRFHAAKYEGRESVLDRPVPPLDCTWGDVVFFSPVDSTLIFDALRASGRSVPGRAFCTVDAGLLDPQQTCIRLMRKSATEPEAEFGDDDDFLPYTTGTLRAVSRITHAALERLRNLGSDEPLLPWVDVPHILHRGPVPISCLQPVG